MTAQEPLPFCWNSRRWLIHGIDPRTCPYLSFQGNVSCIGEGCGYYEEREPTRHVLRLLDLLQETT